MCGTFAVNTEHMHCAYATGIIPCTEQCRGSSPHSVWICTLMFSAVMIPLVTVTVDKHML